MKRLVILLLAAATFSVTAWAQQKQPTRLAVLFVQQIEGPVSITSLTHTMRDQISQVTVENVSDKTVASFQLGWATAIPVGCDGGPMKALVETAPVDEVGIEPHSKATAGSYRLWTKDLLQIARRQGAHFLQTQVGIVGVRFMDGSKWSFDLAKNQIFDQTLLDSESAVCGKGTQGGEIGSRMWTARIIPAAFQAFARGASPDIRGCYWICQGTSRSIAKTMGPAVRSTHAAPLGGRRGESFPARRTEEAIPCINGAA